MRAWTAVGILIPLLGGIPIRGHAGGAAETPEQLVESLMQAARKGDVPGFLSGLTAESGKAMTESYATQASLHKALQAFQGALDKQFGKGAAMAEEEPEPIGAALKRLIGAEVLGRDKVSDDAVTLKVRTTLIAGQQKLTREETLTVRREGGAWKLVLGFAPGDGGAARKAAAEKITREVQDGKYKDRHSAMLALANAWAVKEAR